MDQWWRSVETSGVFGKHRVLEPQCILYLFRGLCVDGWDSCPCIPFEHICIYMRICTFSLSSNTGTFNKKKPPPHPIPLPAPCRYCAERSNSLKRTAGPCALIIRCQKKGSTRRRRTARRRTSVDPKARSPNGHCWRAETAKRKKTCAGEESLSLGVKRCIACVTPRFISSSD